MDLPELSTEARMSATLMELTELDFGCGSVETGDLVELHGLLRDYVELDLPPVIHALVVSRIVRRIRLELDQRLGLA